MAMSTNKTTAFGVKLIHKYKPQTLDHLEDNIRRVIADIRPQMFEKVIENWTSRLDYIRASRGSHLPEIIFKMYHTFRKQRANYCPPYLLGAVDNVDMLNGLLYPNDYKEKQVTRCIEVLPTNSHSAQDTLVKTWK
ncbi:hypothetical protein TNCV_1297611 [Trichonephila clavipes]|nr:hypothetical protein TNCV_1297611 [Trichonephila clavipes]